MSKKETSPKQQAQNSLSALEKLSKAIKEIGFPGEADKRLTTYRENLRMHKPKTQG